MEESVVYAQAENCIGNPTMPDSSRLIVDKLNHFHTTFLSFHHHMKATLFPWLRSLHSDDHTFVDLSEYRYSAN